MFEMNYEISKNEEFEYEFLGKRGIFQNDLETEPYELFGLCEESKKQFPEFKIHEEKEMEREEDDQKLADSKFLSSSESLNEECKSQNSKNSKDSKKSSNTAAESEIDFLSSDIEFEYDSIGAEMNKNYQQATKSANLNERLTSREQKGKKKLKKSSSDAYQKIYHSDSESKPSPEKFDDSSSSDSEILKFNQDLEFKEDKFGYQLFKMVQKVVECEEIKKEDLETSSKIFIISKITQKKISVLRAFTYLMEAKFKGSKSQDWKIEPSETFEEIANNLNDYIKSPKRLKTEKKKKNEDFLKKIIKKFLKKIKNEKISKSRVSKPERVREAYLSNFHPIVKSIMKEFDDDVEKYLDSLNLKTKITLEDLSFNPDFDFHLEDHKEIAFIKIFFTWYK